MLWGNSAATLPAYANDGSAWSDYFGVYHLEGGSGNAVDSSPANNVLTALNSPTLLSDGFSGKSYTISGDKGFKARRNRLVYPLMTSLHICPFPKLAHFYQISVAMGVGGRSQLL